MAARLAPAGRFVVEAFVPDDPPRSGTSVDVRELAVDRVVLAVARYDAGEQAADGQFVELSDGGGVRLRPWSIRWATTEQLDAMAAAAGLVVGASMVGLARRRLHHRERPPRHCLRRAAETGRLGSRLSGQMSQLRLNPLTGRWVTVVAERAERPTDFAPRNRQVEADPLDPCPFCPGNEESTPPALETYGRDGQWVVRIVPNRYPGVLRRRSPGGRATSARCTQAPASGIHEVLVFSPEHGASWADLDDRRPASSWRRSATASRSTLAPRTSATRRPS